MSKTSTASGFSLTANLGWALATLLRDYSRQVEAALGGLPGGSRAFLVMSVVESETRLSQIAIADRLGLDKTTLTYMLDALEQHGLIRRVTDPNDRRSRHIHLTDVGATKLAGFTRAVEQVERLILSRLDADDAARFHDSLLRISGLEASHRELSPEGSHICHIALANADSC